MLYLGIAMVAAATIVYEVALTRIFSIAYGYHFAFLAMSLGLLGFGMSGTLLAMRPEWRKTLTGLRLGWLAAGASAAFCAGYLLANNLPLDPYRVGWDPGQLPLLAFYLAVYATPFLLAGLVQGLPITSWPEVSGKTYGAALLGSGLGGLFALVALESLSAPQALVGAAAAAAPAAGVLGRAAPVSGRKLEGEGRARRRSRGMALSGASVALFAGLALLMLGRPSWLDVRMSEYKPLPQLLQYPDSKHVLGVSNAQSRIDVVESSSVHSAPGLSLAYQGSVPRQAAAVIDGERVLPITPVDDLDPAFIDALPSALAYRLNPNARVLVLEPGAGLEVATALHGRAASVTALDSNPLLVELFRGRLSASTGHVYRDARVRLINANPRAYLGGNDGAYDIISIALSENRRTVTAGAFSLSENYSLTREAFETYLDRLAPGGLLVMHRWLQLPPTEELRAAALAVESLARDGHDPSRHLIGIRSFSTMLILAKNQPFSGDEIEAAKAFAAGRQFDLVHYPGIRPSESNRANVLRNDRYFDSFQTMLDRPETFHRAYEYEVTAPSDDRPFFFHFFKWGQIPTVLSLLGRTWQPFGGTGYLLVLGLLVVTTVLAAGLILIPALYLRRRAGNGGSPTPRSPGAGVYFAMLGLGFLMVEVALVGRFLIVLNHSALAFTIVLFGLLAFCGLGSYLSPRVPWRPALAVLVALIVLYALSLSRVLDAMLGTGLPLRIAAAVILLAPLGVLMGGAFPNGLRRLAAERPGWLPMAWGLNGFTSVIGAVLAALVSLSWGYSVVLGCGGLAYLIALLAVPRADAGVGDGLSPAPEPAAQR